MSKKVAVWASCNYGNYGDDIMAVMFAKTLKSAGAEPVVYRLDEKLSKMYDIKTTNSLEELIQGADFSMISGGSWLESRVLGETYEKDFHDYIETLERHQCPFYALSIGGDSNHDPKFLEPERLRLFTHPLFKEATVRLEGDLEMMASLGVKATYYPDIVLSLSDFWTKKEVNHPRNIGLNISTPHIKIKKWVENFLSKFYPSTNYYFFKTHLPNYNLKYEVGVEKEQKNIFNYQYTDPDSFIEKVNQMDLMISSKLHPGVTAIAYQKPFLLLDGLDKTSSFLKSINAEFAICDYKKLRNILLLNQVDTTTKKLDVSIIKQQEQESKKHFQFLVNLL